MSETNCDSCDCPLLQPWGFHGLELCGPCCTGESDTVDTLTYSCPNKCHDGFEIAVGNQPVCPSCNEVGELTGKAVRPK